jgi:hypothetical protein
LLYFYHMSLSSSPLIALKLRGFKAYEKNLALQLADKVMQPKNAATRLTSRFLELLERLFPLAPRG